MVTAKVGALRQSRQMYDLISIASICNFYLHCQFQTSPGFTYLFKIMFSLIQTLFEKVKLSLTHRGLVTHMRPWTGSLLVMIVPWSLRWRHNGHDSVTNHQPHHCLLNRLLGCRSKKTSKLRVTGLCAGNSPRTCEFPAQMASDAENVSIWRRHHGLALRQCLNQ